MLCGRYVKTFAEASHALPDGMHMSADYPFMLPSIKSIERRIMTIVGSGGQEAQVKIVRRRDGDVAFIAQSSTFERIFKRPPHLFKLLPFKDNDTAAIGEGGK